MEYRSLPSEILDGWAGLRTFIRVTVTNDAGTSTYFDRTGTFCPNSWDLQRTGTNGPPEPTFPQACGSNPFTLGMPWGIDQDWAVQPFPAVPVNLGPGHYQLTVSVTRPYRRLFGIPDDQAVSTVGVTVVASTERCGSACNEGRSPAGAPARLPVAPTVTSPEPDTLPDLVPLPAFSIGTGSGASRDFLAFGANVWVGGSAPLDVQGGGEPRRRDLKAPNNDPISLYDFSELTAGLLRIALHKGIDVASGTKGLLLDWETLIIQDAFQGDAGSR